MAIALFGQLAQDEPMMGKVQATALIVAAGATMAMAAPTNVRAAQAIANGRPATANGRQARRAGGLRHHRLGLVRGFGRRFGLPPSWPAPRLQPLISSGVGRAYVFTETATGWRQRAALKAPDTVGPDWFGDAVAVSGDTIVVGAPAISVALLRARPGVRFHRDGHRLAPDRPAGRRQLAPSATGSALRWPSRDGTIVVGAPSHDVKSRRGVRVHELRQGLASHGAKGLRHRREG